MFTGIIEAIALVKEAKSNGTNKTFTLQSPISAELKIDQSVAHNGVCLTVESHGLDQHTVTAIEETLKKTEVGSWSVGDYINLERCLKLNDRLDGHLVQGHVDTIGRVESIVDLDGSWEYHISYDDDRFVTVPQGSICINGTSLTVAESGKTYFKVCIIPYTFENTNFKQLKIGQVVNLEFDILGKYISRLMSRK